MLFVYLIGIGVDDIFVIVQTWENVGGSIQDERSIPVKIAMTMRHAVSLGYSFFIGN